MFVLQPSHDTHALTPSRHPKGTKGKTAHTVARTRLMKMANDYPKPQSSMRCRRWKKTTAAAAAATALSLSNPTIMTVMHTEAFTPSRFITSRRILTTTTTPATESLSHCSLERRAALLGLNRIDGRQIISSYHSRCRYRLYSLFMEPFNIDDDDDEKNYEEEEEEDEDDDELDPYTQNANSEFVGSTSDLAPVGYSSLDWGSALSSLRTRIDDVEAGVSSNPSNALFRIMTRETPNEAIGKFVNSADPQVVAAMSGAVGSLLGGLSNPVMGVETIVKASGEKLANLCFQLQMTGYMFRNAEYVLALKDLMKIRGKATVEEYRQAFNRIDTDNSGYIEASEISTLLNDVYEGETPAFEVMTFLKFFDANDDGRISREEFERGLGAMSAETAADAVAGAMGRKAKVRDDDDDDDDEDDDEDYVDIGADSGKAQVSGKIKVELESGKVIEVEAQDYINDLKEEAQALKRALAQEYGEPLENDEPSDLGGMMALGGNQPPSASEEVGGVAGYIASLQGDVKSLTEGISPEVVDAMKQLVDFVLDSGGKTKSGTKKLDRDKEMELTGSALQQLALWQLVLGYRLREAEATGDYRKLLE